MQHGIYNLIFRYVFSNYIFYFSISFLNNKVEKELIGTKFYLWSLNFASLYSRPYLQSLAICFSADACLIQKCNKIISNVVCRAITPNSRAFVTSVCLFRIENCVRVRIQQHWSPSKIKNTGNKSENMENLERLQTDWSSLQGSCLFKNCKRWRVVYKWLVKWGTRES